jgi:hypothetical protein
LSDAEQATLIQAKTVAFGGLRDRAIASGKTKRQLPKRRTPPASTVAAQAKIAGMMGQGGS